ncbi:MAG: glycosyltransferase family 2 protein [Pseudomonadota bacterium]
MQTRLPTVLIIMPARNEADTIADVITAIRQRYGYDVLVINDGSIDATEALAQKAGARVVNLMFSLGAWGAMQTGLRYALRHHYDIAITMDADGQHGAESIERLLEALNSENADVVIGAWPQRGSPARKLAWHIFRLLSGTHLRDLTSGLRAYNRQAIRLLAGPTASLLDYQDMGVLLLLNEAGLHVVETPTPMQDRQRGHSRIFSSWWAVTQYMLATMTLCLARSRFFSTKPTIRYDDRLDMP